MTEPVLSIGTTHPWNIAGVGLDARVVIEHGLRPLTVVAAVSAQDGAGVHALYALPTRIVEAQLSAIPSVAAVRIGAVGNGANARAIADWLASRPVPVVVDPVVRASLGGSLADDASVIALLAAARGPASVLTPNAGEAAALTGVCVSSVDEMRQAAAHLRARGVANVLVKGGHAGTADEIVDVLAHDDTIEEFRGARLAHTMRGTGCTLAAALACALAAGCDIPEAVERARRYVRAKIEAHTTFQNVSVGF